MNPTNRTTYKHITDAVIRFKRECNRDLHRKTADLLSSHLNEFKRLLGFDLIFILQPLLIFDRHEFLYSKLEQTDYQNISSNLLKLAYTKRRIHLNEFDQMTPIKAGTNETPLIDTNTYEHTILYPIVNTYKSELGNGGIFYVNKQTTVTLDEKLCDFITLISESIISVYSRYRISEMHRYAISLQRKLQDSMNSAICIYDGTGKIVEINDAYAKLLQKNEEDILGENILDIMKLDGHTNIIDYETVSKPIKSSHIKDLDAKYVDLIKEDGTIMTLRKYFSRVYEDAQSFRMIILEDVSKQLAYVNDIFEKSIKDSLTGLYNRHYLEEYTKKDLARAIYPICVLVGDINGLKLINDIFGHHYGDDIIRMIAEQLRQYCDQGEVFRTGGDEFIIFLHDCDEHKAHAYIDRVCQTCQLNFSNISLLSIALGFCIIPQFDHSLDPFIQKAESNMYLQKSLDDRSISVNTSEKLKSMFASMYPKDIEKANCIKNTVTDFYRNIGKTYEELNDMHTTIDFMNIGKIANTSPLSGRQREGDESIAENYVRVGYKIASLSPKTAHIAKCVLHQYEKWDGTGKPQQLKEKQIPFESRLLAIVNEFYDQCQMADEEHVLNVLDDKKGHAFEPILVDQFIKHRKKQASDS